MLSVHQHWDPLKVCLVGRSYPPEFYSFIENSKVRSVMERIAIETEEDYQKLITLLEKFNVKVIRTDISDDFEDHYYEPLGRYFPPPMCPRDYTGMIGNNFYAPDEHYGTLFLTENINDFRKHKDYEKIVKEFPKILEYYEYMSNSTANGKDRDKIVKIFQSFYQTLRVNFISNFVSNDKVDSLKTAKEYILNEGNEIVYGSNINTASITRIGKDLYFGCIIGDEYDKKLLSRINDLLPHHRCHLICDIHGHTDSNFCPVKPGLILSLSSIKKYKQTFPDWEVISLPNQSWDKVKPFLDLKQKNKGKWWVPGEEYNNNFTDFIESWLNHWVYYVEETIFDVNILVIDENNVVCNNYNKEVFDAFERHNITPHIINFRHRYFWDGGLHCITSDLDRDGTQKDFFPNRDGKIYLYKKNF
jgi:hypothetical protein